MDSFRIDVYDSLTGKVLFSKYLHNSTEDRAEEVASYWWNDETNTRATYYKI